MTLTIKVELMPGSSFESASAEMQALADRLGINVAGSFNEVRLCAHPGGRADWLAANGLARRLKPRPHYNGAHSSQEPSAEDLAAIAAAEHSERPQP